MIVVAILTVAEPAAFAEFEDRAALVMARHGGALERAIACPAAGDAPAREIHVIRFTSADAFAAYRADPELAALAPLLARGVAATEILVGDDVSRA